MALWIWITDSAGIFAFIVTILLAIFAIAIGLQWQRYERKEKMNNSARKADGNLIVIGDGGSLKDQNLLLIREFKGHIGQISCSKISNCGSVIVSGDKEFGEVIFWSSSSNDVKCRKRIVGDYANLCDISDNAEFAVFSLANTRILQLYEIFRGNDSIRANLKLEFMTRHSSEITGCIFSTTNHKLIVTCARAYNSLKGEVRIWNCFGECVYNYQNRESEILSCSISFDRRFIAIGSCSPIIEVVELSQNDGSFSKVYQKLYGHKRRVNMISFDSKKIGDKGTYELCSVSEDNRLLIWNGEKGNLLKEILLDELPGAIANSGSVLALGIGKSIIYRSKRFGDIIYNISEAHLDSITSLSFSQNGLELLSSGGKILRLWNVPNQY